MSEYFKYEALDIPDKPATEVLKSKGLDLDFTPKQYQFIPELNTGDFHINGLNLDGYFSINKAKEPIQYKYTQLKLNHNTPSKNKQILEQTLDKYGSMSADELVKLTHKPSSPWCYAGSGDVSYRRIDDKLILKYHKNEIYKQACFRACFFFCIKKLWQYSYFSSIISLG